MSTTQIDTAEAAGTRPRFNRWLAGAAITALAVTGLIGQGAAANAAGETVSVQTYEVQQGSYQTFFVGGLAASSTYTATLSRTNASSTNVGSKTFTTDASGNPTEAYLRLVVSGSATLANDYEVRLRAGTATSGAPLVTSTPSLEVIAPNSTGAVTATVINSGNTVRVVGTGFRRTNTAYNSVIGVKLDNGAIKHSDTAGDLAPVPKPYPSTGSSPEDVWYYIGEPNTGATGTDATYNGASGYPNAAYASNDIVGGSFTVDIPIGSVSAGTHTLRFLTGSLDDATWQSPSSALYPDQGRSVTVSFTK